ncbi:hypothetical protein KB553_09630 [Chryseobacterium rhizoplanae]|uniref:type VI secretion system baseplate subunit TssG n=1 Tax=Chryseobacterium rhizoplanae TaxID=1609531 RepID=UPI001CE3AEFF|nr:hypothetical protein [Chryseobacterium rhizoplanae]UCA61773.1 hypothetical protein KB553_09630 [Chryseobacterium rhizoplanae]
MGYFENIAEEIGALYYDIRAEVVVSNLLKSGDLEGDDYIIEKDGQFSRAYRYDILASEVSNCDLGRSDFLKLILSRDSIYDLLPEHITHDTGINTTDKNVDEMIQQYRIKKQEQKKSRLFFQPFENEIFRYGVEIETFEQDFLSELFGSLAPDMFYDFLGIDGQLYSPMTSKLIRILPFAYKVVGDIELTAQILSLILEEKVKITRKSWKKYDNHEESSMLGECKLGLDMVAGNCYDHYSDHLQLSIGPLQKGVFSDYINGGAKKRFLDLFSNYFFSADSETEINILLQKETEVFDLKATNDTLLGYNTRI